MQAHVTGRSRLRNRSPALYPRTSDPDAVRVAVSLLDIEMLAVADKDPDAVAAELCKACGSGEAGSSERVEPRAPQSDVSQQVQSHESGCGQQLERVHVRSEQPSPSPAQLATPEAALNTPLQHPLRHAPLSWSRRVCPWQSASRRERRGGFMA
jgi:hypothetical protein